jgi:hypothetical protein
VPVNSTVVIAINELNPGGGSGHSFELLVEGFYDSSFSDVPEPSTFITGLAAAVFLAVGRFRRHQS